MKLSQVSLSRTMHLSEEGLTYCVDRPLTDLYDTEGSGDFSPARFMARPVVGGHFAPLALERACHGKGSASLRILDEGSESPYVGNTWAADTHAKEREDGPSEL